MSSPLRERVKVVEGFFKLMFYAFTNTNPNGMIVEQALERARSYLAEHPYRLYPHVDIWKEFIEPYQPVIFATAYHKQAAGAITQCLAVDIDNERVKSSVIFTGEQSTNDLQTGEASPETKRREERTSEEDFNVSF